MKVGKVETQRTKVNVLGRTKVRTHDVFFTVPEAKHRDNIHTLLDLWHAKPSRVAGRKIPRTESNTQCSRSRTGNQIPQMYWKRNLFEHRS